MMEGCLRTLFSDKLSGPFDYIVVGGGTAGCVVASRLSQDPKVNVLLLEAGGWDKKTEIRIPAEASSLRETEIDWKYLTVPQIEACKAKIEQQDQWSTGKVIGGCSSMDNMLYARGNKADYDSWASLGADGWRWEEVLPFFLVSENNTRQDFVRSPLHNRGGLLTVSDNTFSTPLAKSFIEAAKEVGHHQSDITCGINIGVGFPQSTITNGGRCSTATAFLKPALARPNLTVATNALVHKIVIYRGRAIGVYVTVEKKLKEIRTLREVILSAGTIGSAKLLMLSGIGPRSHLEDVNINCICDLPIGKNLQEQIAVPIKVTLEEGSGAITTEEKDSMSTYFQYIFSGKGILSSNGVEGTAFMRTGVNSSCEWPDIQINFIPMYYHLGNDEPTLTRLKKLSYDKMMDYYDWEALRMKKEGVTFFPILLHPRSTGEVTLNSSNPWDLPRINPRYLEDIRDVAVLKEGIKQVKRLLDTEAMRQTKLELCDLRMPGELLAFSDKNLDAYIRHFASSANNPVGTCKMGAINDSNAVVDPHLRIRGLRGLRVIDASVMPHLPSANSSASTIMLAEKGASFITKEHDAVMSYYHQPVLLDPIPQMTIEF